MRNLASSHRFVYFVMFCVIVSSISAVEVQQAPQSILDWQKEAQEEIAQNDPAGAVESYQKIQQAYPDTVYAADAQKQVILTCLQANQADKTLNALSEFNQKYSLQPDYISHMKEIINRMADVNMASQAKETCLSLLERLPDNPEMLWILQGKSRCEIFMKTPDQADQTVKVMQQKYAAHPQYADALNWTAYEYRRMGFPTQAAELYKSILAQNPSAEIQLRCRSGLALINLGLGDTDNAIKEAQQMKTSIRSYQKYIQTTELEEVINALADTGQPGIAQEICQAAVEQFTDTPALLWIWQRKARCELFMHKLGLADESVKVMQQKYATQPDYVDALNWTAYEYRRMGYFARSWELYNSILAQKPDKVVQLRSIAGLILSDLGLESTANAAHDAQRIKTSIQSMQKYVRIYELEDAINALTDAGGLDAAREMCQAITDQFSDEPSVLWIWQRKARCEAFMKKLNLADESVNIMQQKYANHPEYADALGWTAYEYNRMGFYARAWELYNSILALNPSEVIQQGCCAGLIYSDLGLNDTAKTTKDVEQIKARIRSCQNYHKTDLENAINALVDAGQMEAAREICRTITTQFPDDPQMMWIWQRQARCEVIMKKFNLADESVAQMQKFSVHPQYAEALSWTAYECCKAGYYQKAVELSQMALNQKGSLEDQIRSFASQARAYVRLGQEDKTQANVEVLLSQYGKIQPDSVASYLFGIGEEYCLMAENMAAGGSNPEEIRKMYQKAVTIWDMGVQNLKLDTILGPDYAYSMGMACQRMVQHKEAIGWFRQVLDKWPQYDRAWNAQFMIAVCYDQLFKKELISVEEAKKEIIAACQQLEGQYPASNASAAAKVLVTSYEKR